MDFAKELKKAMIERNISTALELSEQTGVSYYITRRLLKNDGTCTLSDLKVTAEFLGVKVKFISEGV